MLPAEACRRPWRNPAARARCVSGNSRLVNPTTTNGATTAYRLVGGHLARSTGPGGTRLGGTRTGFSSGSRDRSGVESSSRNANRVPSVSCAADSCYRARVQARTHSPGLSFTTSTRKPKSAPVANPATPAVKNEMSPPVESGPAAAPASAPPRAPIAMPLPSGSGWETRVSSA